VLYDDRPKSPTYQMINEIYWSGMRSSSACPPDRINTTIRTFIGCRWKTIESRIASSKSSVGN